MGEKTLLRAAPRGTGAKRGSRPASHLNSMERVMGIEPTHPAWKAGVLPLNYTRIKTVMRVRDALYVRISYYISRIAYNGF